MNPIKFGPNWVAFLVVVGGLMFCLQNVDTASTTPSNSKVCQTEACKNIATSILHKMNQTAKPCDNFYEFVCGNFSRNAEIPSSRSVIDLINQLRVVVVNQLKNSIENQITDKDPEAFQKLHTYYKTCIDEAQIEKTSSKEFLEIVKELGGWPVLLGKSFDDSKFDWKDAIKKISKMGYLFNYFLTVEFESNLKNITRNILYLDQPELGLSQEYLSQGLKNDVVNAYFKFMVDVAEIFGANREQAKLELADSLNFEIELANISLPASERRDVEKLYNPMKISEIQSKYPIVPWLQYLNDHLSPFHKLTENEVVNVAVPSFFESLGDLLARTPKRVLANYAMWKVAFASTTGLNQKVRDANLEFSAALNGNSNKNPRWQECISYSSSDLHVATSSLYVRRNFDKASKDGVTDMIKHLRQGFKQILLDVDWMDETTRSAALKKLEQIMPLVGYFDESLDDEKINDYYEDMKLYPESYLKTVLSYERFNDAKRLKSFRDPVPRADWTNSYSASDVVNAFYSSGANTIQFPAGILQGDSYNAANPKYINYGAIGSIIGHEMTHGFDDQGSKFDGTGNLVDWWEAQTKKEYLKRAQCIVDQYSSYIDPQVNLHVNGELTQGENIADNGGVKEAYLAYKAFEEENGEEPTLPGFEDFTPKQMFWVSYGNFWCARYRSEFLKFLITTDTHSPNQFRIIGPLSNNPYFAKDFNCPLDSPMNPQKKCTVW